jgi:hypothetical protein
VVRNEARLRSIGRAVRTPAVGRPGGDRIRPNGHVAAAALVFLGAPHRSRPALGSAIGPASPRRSPPAGSAPRAAVTPASSRTCLAVSLRMGRASGSSVARDSKVSSRRSAPVMSRLAGDRRELSTPGAVPHLDVPGVGAPAGPGYCPHRRGTMPIVTASAPRPGPSKNIHATSASARRLAISTASLSRL